MDVVERVFAARRIDLATLRAKREPLPVPPADDVRARSVDTSVAPTAPKLAALTNGVLFDDLWRRTDLKPRDRSLVTIAALAAGGDSDQLAFHIKRGIENGLTRDQIGEALTHLAFYAGWPKAMAAVSVAARALPAEPEPSASLTIVPAGDKPARGPASNFTGSVATDTPFRGTGPSRLSGARVIFQPGARSNWHSHPLGQLLFVTQGRGLIQDEGGTVRMIRAGDAIWTAPGVRHWHGAAPDSSMTHVGVSEAVDGEPVVWFEPVSDEQYGRRPAP